MSEPRTQAGRNLLSNHWLTNPYGEAREGMRHAILAIETEALPSVERLATALCSTHHLVPTDGHELTSDAVDREHGPQARAILAALRDESGVASSPEPVTSVRPRSTDDAAPRGGADVT